jgi:hypothetical protein
LEKRRPIVTGLSQQGIGIIAQFLLCRRRDALPAAGTFECIHVDFQSAINIAFGDDFGRRRDPRRQRGGAGGSRRLPNGLILTFVIPGCAFGRQLPT